jgi:hypothetical protein
MIMDQHIGDFPFRCIGDSSPNGQNRIRSPPGKDLYPGNKPLIVTKTQGKNFVAPGIPNLRLQCLYDLSGKPFVRLHRYDTPYYPQFHNRQMKGRRREIAKIETNLSPEEPTGP